MSQKLKKCYLCQEKILEGRDFSMNNRTICLGCAVEAGIAQQMEYDIFHKLNCKNKHCFKCQLGHYKTMYNLGYVQTEIGNWYKPTDDPKIVVIYEDLLTNLPTYSVSKKVGNL
jgi:hypothetical protein